MLYLIIIGTVGLDLNSVFNLYADICSGYYNFKNLKDVKSSRTEVTLKYVVYEIFCLISVGLNGFKYVLKCLPGSILILTFFPKKTGN